MEPRTLSASGIETWQSCSARYKAEYIDRIPTAGSTAASLGSAVHDALEQYIIQELHLNDGKVSDLHAFLEDGWWKFFDERDPSLFKEGKDMLVRWHERQDWSEREVVMAEVKERFELPIPLANGGEHIFPVTYIWDRCDRHADGTIEVIDYKSYGSPLPVDVLKERIQPRLYALAAFIRFKEEKPPEIWVTFDLLRHQEISVRFTREECVETWNYMRRVGARILADPGTEERLNGTCHWCARRTACETLAKAHTVGNPLAMGEKDIFAVARRYEQVSGASKALYDERDQLGAFIKEYFEREGISPRDGLVNDDDGTHVRLSVKPRRDFHPERVARLIGPDLMAQRGKLTLGELDALLKGDELDEETKEKISKQITKSPGAVTIIVKNVKNEYKEGE